MKNEIGMGEIRWQSRSLVLFYTLGFSFLVKTIYVNLSKDLNYTYKRVGRPKGAKFTHYDMLLTQAYRLSSKKDSKKTQVNG